MMCHSITYKGVSKIADALTVNISMQILDLSHNYISDEGAGAISECLKSNTTLQNNKHDN